MSVRKKLIELLHSGGRCPSVVGDEYDCYDCPHHSPEIPCDEFAATADMLIAHGVTAQEWISVEDRLPEYDQVVLCYKDGRGVRIGKHMPATYADGVVAFKDLVRDYAFGATHWMPLPEPPKADMRGENNDD